jgi:hypothetical protein
MPADTKGILTKPAAIAFGVIMLFGGLAVGSAGVAWRARGEFDQVTTPKIALSSPFALQQPDPAVTAEQVRQLTAAITGLQAKLDETIKQVNELNGRLSRLEGIQAAQH